MGASSYKFSSKRAGKVTVDLFVIYDTTPFGLSLSKPVLSLTKGPSTLPVMICGSHNP